MTNVTKVLQDIEPFHGYPNVKSLAHSMAPEIDVPYPPLNIEVAHSLTSTRVDRVTGDVYLPPEVFLEFTMEDAETDDPLAIRRMCRQQESKLIALFGKASPAALFITHHGNWDYMFTPYDGKYTFSLMVSCVHIKP